MMNDKGQNILSGYFPLWGASFESNDVAIVGDHVAAYIPDADEWRQIQKTDVWLERLRNNPNFLDVPPPPCLVVMQGLKKKEDIRDGIARLGAWMIESAQDATLAFRLYKKGWFLDPGLSEQIFALGSYNFRMVGPYRLAFLAGTPEDTPPGYIVQINELPPKKTSSSPIKNMWQLIHRYREEGAHASADIAIENFHRSYGYQLSNTQRAAFLFMTLDAILGGMSIPHFDKVEINVRFRERVEAALSIIAGLHGIEKVDPGEEAAWIDSQGRDIRNAIAHGRHISVAELADVSCDRLKYIIRLLLRQYLEFSIKWVAGSNDISSEFNMTAQCSPVEAYNKILERTSQGAINATDILRFDVSEF